MRVGQNTECGANTLRFPEAHCHQNVYCYVVRVHSQRRKLQEASSPGNFKILSAGGQRRSCALIPPLSQDPRSPASLLYGCFLQEASHSWGQECQSQDCSCNFPHSHTSWGWFQESLEIAIQGCPSPWYKMNTVAPPYLWMWKFINWRGGRGTVVRGNRIFHKNPKMQWWYFLQHYPRARFWSTWKRKGLEFGWLRPCLSHISVILPFGDMEVFRVILYLQYKSDFPY